MQPLDTLRDLTSGAVALTGKGRLARDLYWLGLAGVALCNLCLFRSLESSDAVPSPAAALSSILVFWAWIVLFIRRGHDLGISGFLTVLGIVLSMAASVELAKHLPTTTLLLQLGVVIGFGVLPGNAGPNRYGMPLTRRR